MTAPLFDPNLVRHAIEVLVEPGNVFEIRALDAKLGNQWRKGTVSGYFDNADAVVASLAGIASAKSIYMTMNPVMPDLLARRCNRLDLAEKSETTSDHHIIWRRWLLVDHDPKRPAGISATDAELIAGLERTDTVAAFLAEHGWPSPVKAKSGNGGHLLYRIDLPADDGELIHRILTGLKARFSDTIVGVDETVFNPARITKLYGTLACKGDSVPSRPHRMSGLVAIPNPLCIVSREQLEALAAELTPVVSVAKGPVLPRISSGSSKKFNLQDFFQQHGIVVKDTKTTSTQTLYILETCPFNADHGGRGEVAVFEQTDGTLGFKCHHDGCAGMHWHDFRQHYDPGCFEKRDGYKTERINGQLVTTVPSAGLTEEEKKARDKASYAVAVAAAQDNSKEPEDMIILPGNGVTITQTSEKLFQRIAPTKTLFQRGGAVVELERDHETKLLQLEIISPSAARSRLECYGNFFVWRAGKNGENVLKPTVLAEEMARALLESKPAQGLPAIAGLANCPIITTTGEILGQGYHADQMMLVTGGDQPPTVDLKEAVAALKDLVAEYDFQTPGDRSRALASFITPALKMGGFIRGNIPVDAAEADQSQSGKTYRQKVVAAIYNDKVVLVTFKNGGVGSVDESFNAKLVAGRPFIQLDNYRGKFDSPHIEAFLTAEGKFPARIPHCREVDVDPSRFFIMLSSNGVETTRDFANRSNIIRIRKRVDFVFRKYPEGLILPHVQSNQPYYLGCVFAIINAWRLSGCQRTNETRHDFRDWVTALDWIVQNILGEVPLMDGHQSAQERVSNPALTFLRKLALKVIEDGRANEKLIASQLYEIADVAGLDIPGLKDADEDKGKRCIGGVMGRLFKEGNRLEVDGFIVQREEVPTPRKDGRGDYASKIYQFSRILADASNASNASKGLNVRENSTIFPEVVGVAGVTGGLANVNPASITESAMPAPIPDAWQALAANVRPRSLFDDN